MPEFQVWHKNGNRHDKVATVKIGNVEGAAILTALRTELWSEHTEISPEPGEHRSTMFGDIIIDPEAKEYRFEVVNINGYEYPGFTEVTTIFDQGHTESLAERAIEDAAAIDFIPTAPTPTIPLDPELDRVISELEASFLDQAEYWADMEYSENWTDIPDFKQPAPGGWEYAETDVGEDDLVPDMKALAEEIRIDTQAGRMRDAGEDYEAFLRQAAMRGGNKGREGPER